MNSVDISNLTRKFKSDEYTKLPGWIWKKIYEARQKRQSNAVGSRQLSAITTDYFNFAVTRGVMAATQQDKVT